MLENLISNLINNKISYENFDQLLLIKEKINLLGKTIEEIKIDKLEEINIFQLRHLSKVNWNKRGYTIG